MHLYFFTFLSLRSFQVGMLIFLPMMISIECFATGISLSHSDSTYDKSNVSYLKIKALLNKFAKINDSKTTGIYYGQMGDIFFTEGITPQALRYYLMADSIFTIENEHTHLAVNLNKIGRVYFKNALKTKALKCFEQSFKLFKQQRNRLGMGESLSYIARVYESMNMVQQAYAYQELALEEFKQLNDKSKLASAYASIGSIYEDKSNFNLALHYFFKALELYKKETSANQLAGLLNNIGDAYRKMGHYQQALVYSKKAEHLSVLLNDNRQLSSAHRDLAKTYEFLAKFDSAYYYSEKARIAYSKSYNTDNNKKLNLIQTLFDVQQKDSEIVHLEHERRVNKILAISVTLSGILILFLGISVLSRQRLKSEKGKVLFETQKKAMELKLENKQLTEESLKSQLELRSKELTAHTLHIIHKNQFIEDLKNKLAAIVKDDKRDQRKELKQLIGIIGSSNNQDVNWNDFRNIYENVHENFFEKLRQHSGLLSNTDLRFLALLKMNLSSADIAAMLGVSQDSLRTTRYRIKKKLLLLPDEDLLGFLQRL